MVHRQAYMKAKTSSDTLGDNEAKTLVDMLVERQAAVDA